MPIKTARDLIEDEVREYRTELLRDVTKRSELRADGFNSDEIDAVIQEEKDEVEREVAELRAKLMKELPQRESELAEERDHTFAVTAFNDVWLAQCLTPADGEASGLVTKEVYDSYLSWCGMVGISEPYSLGKVRSSLKIHYEIEDIRKGLREYRLAEVSTNINRDQIVARYEAGQRKQEREAARLRELTCPYCERRKYDGNRYDRCYWCNRILRVGFQAALAEYLSQDVGWERSGLSMRNAYQRMIDAGDITPPVADPIVQEEPRRAAGIALSHNDAVSRGGSDWKQKVAGLWAAFKRWIG